MSSPDRVASAEAVAGRVAAAFGELPQVAAVAWAGSRAVGGGDDASDIDLYVYAEESVPLATRGAIAARFAAHPEVGNAFWEPGDEWIDAATGLHVDMMHRTPAWIEEQLDRVLVRHEASVGYSTCFWHNVLRSRTLYDGTGWYGRLQTWAEQPYPEALKLAVVAKNHPILRQSLSSYARQIERALRRGDGVSMQHRVSALLASYFDILFAVNELPHPGEKGMLAFAAARCRKLPVEMEETVNALLDAPPRTAPPAIRGAIAVLLTNLDALLAEEGLAIERGRVQSIADSEC